MSQGLALQTINKEQSVAECSVPDYALIILYLFANTPFFRFLSLSYYQHWCSFSVSFYLIPKYSFFIYWLCFSFIFVFMADTHLLLICLNSSVCVCVCEREGGKQGEYECGDWSYTISWIDEFKTTFYPDLISTVMNPNKPSLPFVMRFPFSLGCGFSLGWLLNLEIIVIMMVSIGTPK